MNPPKTAQLISTKMTDFLHTEKGTLSYSSQFLKTPSPISEFSRPSRKKSSLKKKKRATEQILQQTSCDYDRSDLKVCEKGSKAGTRKSYLYFAQSLMVYCTRQIQLQEISRTMFLMLLLCLGISFSLADDLQGLDQHLSEITPSTSQNHFLEAELPLAEVLGVEGEEVRIPCDVTSPSSRDTPSLIIIMRGKTPLYSVDARSESSSPSIHWVNTEVLGSRAQFLMPLQLSRHKSSSLPIESGVYNYLGDAGKSPPIHKFKTKFNNFDKLESIPNISINRDRSRKVIRDASDIPIDTILVQKHTAEGKFINNSERFPNNTRHHYLRNDNTGMINGYKELRQFNDIGKRWISESNSSVLKLNAEISINKSHNHNINYDSNVAASQQLPIFPETFPTIYSSNKEDENISDVSKKYENQLKNSQRTLDQSLVSDTIEDNPKEVKYGTLLKNTTINYYRVVFPHKREKKLEQRSYREKGMERRMMRRGIGEFGRTDYSSREYGVLIIRNLLRSDGGNFHCRVDFKDAPTRHSQSRLSVIVPPSNLDIRGPAGLRILDSVGPFEEGEALNLWCSASGGRPTPSVSWWLDDVLLDDSSQQTDNFVTNNITIPTLTRKHFDNLLVCKAHNSNMTSPLEASVKIVMRLPPITVNISEVSKGVMEGRLHKLTCSSSGSRPPAELTWWARAQQLTHATYQESPDGSVSTSVLHLLVSAADNDLKVSCRAANKYLPPATALEDSVKITVYYAPSVTLKLSPLLNVSNIDENNDVYLDCDVKANPPAELVKWSHNKVPIVPNKAKGIVQSNMSLVLQRVSRKSSGVYTCSAANKFGSSTSNELQLTVKFSPVCKGPSASEIPLDIRNHSPDINTSNDNMPLHNSLDRGSEGPSAKVYGTGVGVAVNISCLVDAHPMPHIFHWSLNSTTQENNAAKKPEHRRWRSRPQTNTSIPKGSTSNRLTYTPHTAHEFGTLLCWAENSVGRQSDPCVFQIVPASTPGPVHNCSITQTSPSSPNSILLRCSPGWDGGLQQTFTLIVLQGKDYSANRSTGEYSEMNSYKTNKTTESISGGISLWDKDTQNSRERLPLEEGELANLSGQELPQFNVSGLAAGRLYILKVYSSNARGNSDIVFVNYVTPIDVAEGRLSSESAYNSTTNSNKRGIILVAIVITVLVVFLVSLGTIILIITIRKKKRKQQGEQNSECSKDEHFLKSTSLLSARESESNLSEYEIQSNKLTLPVSQPQSTQGYTRVEMGVTTPTFLSNSYCTIEQKSPMQLPGLQNPVFSGTMSNMNNFLPKERIVRQTAQEPPPNPDLLLYRLAASDRNTCL